MCVFVYRDINIAETWTLAVTMSLFSQSFDLLTDI